jgi:hypothetical protein
MTLEESKQKIKEIKLGTVDKKSLAGIKISKTDFNNLDINVISGANMKYATLFDVGFHKLNMNSVDFTYSEIDDIELDNTSLFQTLFVNCTINNSTFTEVNMLETDFTNTTLSNTFISSKSWRKVRFENTTFKNVTFGNLSKHSYKTLKQLLNCEQRSEIMIYTVDGERVLFDDYIIPETKKTSKPHIPPPDITPLQETKIEKDIEWKPGARSNIPGCPSHGLLPVQDCKRKRQQSLIFHPDKNPSCQEIASNKMQNLNTQCP